MSEAVSKAKLHKNIYERMGKEIPQSRADLGGYHTGKRDAYLNVISDMVSGTFDLSTDVDISELETENRMQAERNRRLKKELNQAVEALQEIRRITPYGMYHEMIDPVLQQIKGVDPND